MSSLGVDLGTTALRGAIVADGEAVLLEDQGGSSAFPVEVSLDGGRPRAGRLASARAATAPERCVIEVKRLLGRSQAEVERARPDLCGRVTTLEGGALALLVDGQPIRIEDAAATVLDQLAEAAARSSGQAARSVVLAAPAWLDGAGRGALRAAARKAGLPAIAILSDVAACALVLATRRRHLRVGAILDVGAGGVSVGVVAIGAGGVTVLGSSGDGTLGGADVGRAVASLLRARIDPQLMRAVSGPALEASLLHAARAIEENLGTADRASEVLPYVRGPGGAPVEVALSRAELDALLEGLADRMVRATEAALTQAQLRPSDIEVLHATGGVAHALVIRRAMERALGREPRFDLPEGTIACGAALRAAALEGEIAGIDVDDREPTRAPSPARPPARRLDGACVLGPPRALTPEPHALAPSSPAAPQPLAVSPPPAPTPEPPTASPPRRATTPPRSGARTAAEPSLRGHPTGRIARPTTATALIELAATRPVTPADLDPIALPVLLLRLAARASVSGLLRLTSGSARVEIAIEAGVAHLTKADHAAITHAFAWPTGTYAFEEGEPNTAHRQPASMVSLACEGLRAALRGWSAEELEVALADRLDRAPIAAHASQQRLRHLGLSGAERRLIEHATDGAASVRSLAAHGGAGRHTTLALVVLLSLFDLVRFGPVTDHATEGLAVELDRRASRGALANHFDALEVHWSALEPEIVAAYRARCEAVAEGSPWRAANPTACDRMRARADAAWAVLGDPVTRAAHRADAYPLDFFAVCDLAEKSAAVLDFRGAEGEARSQRAVAHELAASDHGGGPRVITMEQLLAADVAQARSSGDSRGG